jgi:tetratricopeptide (TPR) repeat protein
MDIIRRYQKTGGDLTDDDILDRYDKISSVLGSKQGDKYATMQGQIDGMLSEVVTVDCNFVEQNLGAKYDEDPGNTKLAKKIIQLSLSGKCTDSPLFMKAAKGVFAAEPDFGMAKVIGLKCKGNGDNACAKEYLTQALTLTEDNTKKGEIYLALGGMEAERGARSSARDFFRKSVSVDPSLASKAYGSIGNLYFTSFNNCKAGVSKVDDRGCYLAAYEMFRRAGNSSAMQRAKDQFPSKEEVFLEGKSVGATLSVGCWIGESVTIQTRD